MDESLLNLANHLLGFPTTRFDIMTGSLRSLRDVLLPIHNIQQCAQNESAPVLAYTICRTAVHIVTKLDCGPLLVHLYHENSGIRTVSRASEVAAETPHLDAGIRGGAHSPAHIPEAAEPDSGSAAFAIDFDAESVQYRSSREEAGRGEQQEAAAAPSASSNASEAHNREFEANFRKLGAGTVVKVGMRVRAYFNPAAAQPRRDGLADFYPGKVRQPIGGIHRAHTGLVARPPPAQVLQGEWRVPFCVCRWSDAPNSAWWMLFLRIATRLRISGRVKFSWNRHEARGLR